MHFACFPIGYNSPTVYFPLPRHIPVAVWNTWQLELLKRAAMLLFRDKQKSYVQFQKYSQDIRAVIGERLFNDADKEGLLDCHNEVKKCTDEEKENEFKIVKGKEGL